MKTVHDFHGKVKPFVCDLCTRAFSFRVSLEKHTKNHLGTSNGQAFKKVVKKRIKFSCEMCSEVFTLTRKLKDHMKTVHDFHGKVKPFVCDVCKKAFSFRVSLEKHSKNHLGTSNGQAFKKVIKKRIKFSCEMCSEVFTLTRKLKDHMKTVHDFHGKVKPFVCDVCKKAFSFKASYRKHIQNHSAPKPLQTSTSEEANMSIGPYPCTMCDQQFESPHNLSYHLKQDHEVAGKDKVLDSLFLSLCIFLSMYIFLYLSFSLLFSLSHFLSLSPYICVSFSFSLSRSLFLSLSF